MLHASSSNQLGLAGMDLAKPACMSRSPSHHSMPLSFHERYLAMSPRDTMTVSLLHAGLGGPLCTIDIRNFVATVNGPVAPGIGVVYDAVADEIKTRCFNELSSLMGMQRVDTCEARIFVTWHSTEVGRVVVNSLHRSVHLWTTSLYDWHTCLDAGEPGDADASDVIPSDAIMSEVLLRIHADAV